MAEFSGWRQQASNKNLLINPRFKVNQRGQMEYTGAGYGVDGWWLQHVTTANVKDNHVHVSGLWQMEQKLEDVGAGTYTFSIYAENVTGLAELQVADKSRNLIAEKKMQNGITAISFKTNEGVNSVGWFGLGSADSSSDLYAAKLEQGPISTLALDLMQPYTPQDYQRELRECQRYFVASYDNWLPMAAAIRGQGLVVIVPLNAPMRIKPSLSTNLISVFGEDGAWHEYEFSVQRVKDNVAILSTTIDENYFIQGNSYLVKNLPALSAEL